MSEPTQTPKKPRELTSQERRVLQIAVVALLALPILALLIMLLAR